MMEQTHFKRASGGAGKMARWVKALAAKLCDLSLIPEVHVEEGKNEN